MKKILSLAAAFWLVSLSQILACSACFGDYRGVTGGTPPNVQHMALAIWVLMFIVMSVLGGIGAFSWHLWRQSRMPIEPHEQLVEEDLSQYA
jgi:membrane protein YdbS with pleckstrin-like domain